MGKNRYSGLRQTAAIILLITVLLTSCGNDKKAFEKAKQAYDNISAAYELVEKMGSDIYSAWKAGIYEDIYSAEDLAEEVNLSKEDLIEGIAVFYARYLDDISEPTYDEYKEYNDSDHAELYFLILEDDMFR